MLPPSSFWAADEGALRRILPIALALAIAAGPVAPAAVAGPAVSCTRRLELIQKGRSDPEWFAVVKVSNLRPHAATVSGRWKVQTFDGPINLHRSADLGGDDSKPFLVVVQEHHLKHPPTIELLSCT
jgi:hypothetical protein